MRYLIIFLFLFTVNVSAQAIELKCDKSKPSMFNYFNSFTILPEKKLIVEAYKKSPNKIYWNIDIIQNNFIEARGKLDSLMKNRGILKVFLEEKKIIINYEPTGGQFTYYCR